MDDRRPSRQEHVAEALSALTSKERRQLEKAADGLYLGGDPVSEPLLSEVANSELVYKCSGRLKPDVLKLLSGDDAVLVGGRG